MTRTPWVSAGVRTVLVANARVARVARIALEGRTCRFRRYAKPMVGSGRA